MSPVSRYGPTPGQCLRWTAILTEILDLSESDNHGALGTSLQELTGDRAYLQDEFLKGGGPLPPTQVLGKAAYDCGAILGFKYVAAKNVAEGVGFVVFADRLATKPPSYLEVYDPHHNLRERRPS